MPAVFDMPHVRRAAMDASSGDSARGEQGALEVARDRAAPPFYIVDARLRVVFRPAGAAGSDASSTPERLQPAVRRLAARLASGENPAVTVDVISATELIRVVPLDAGSGDQHYAVFLERFAQRASVDEAAKRYGLSARETQVLEALMRGHSTRAIAEALDIAPTTVQEYIRKIGQKTNATKRSLIVATVFGLR